MNSPDFVSFASEVAREAGALLLSYQERGVQAEYKGSFDLVTAADRASEKLVVERIRTRFPDHSIVAEEGSGSDLGSEHVWHIDPLDGTTNFAHGFPVYAVSIGLEKVGEPVAGVVYDPTRDELFAAEKGSGAYLNNRRIRISGIADLSKGLFATGFPPAIRAKNPNVYNFHQFSVLTHGARRAGSAALDICSVACGRLEGFWEIGLKSWDVSAGRAILSEAGGRCTDMSGGPYMSGDPDMLVSNGAVHQQMIDLFVKVSRGQLEAPIPPLGGGRGRASD